VFFLARMLILLRVLVSVYTRYRKDAVCFRLCKVSRSRGREVSEMVHGVLKCMTRLVTCMEEAVVVLVEWWSPKAFSFRGYGIAVA